MIYHLKLCLYVTVFETPWYAQPNITLFALCPNLVPLLCTCRTDYTVHPCFSYSTDLRWWLLSSRQPIHIAKADDLLTDCSWSGCSPASCNIFLTCVSLKSLCQNLESQDSRRMWLFRITRSRQKISFFVHFHVWHLSAILSHLLT
jgi:hypothetical protein